MEGTPKGPMELWQSHLPLAYGLIRRYQSRWRWVGGDDLEQAGLMGLWQAALSYRIIPTGDGSCIAFSTYAHKTVRNQLQSTVYASHVLGESFGRAVGRGDFTGDRNHEVDTIIDISAFDRANEITPSECATIIGSLMRSCISPIERGVLESIYWDGMRVKDIAVRYGKTPPWVRWIHARAVKRMARRLELNQPERVGGHNKWSREKISKLLSDLSSGARTADVARRHGVSAARIYAIANKMRKGIVDGSN